MIDLGYFKNPIEAPIKIGLDFLTGNLKTDGKTNTPIDYAAPVYEEKVTEPAKEFVQENVVEPVQGGVKVVTDAFSNGIKAAESLVVGGIDSIKKYAPLAIGGVIVAALLFKK